MIDSAKKGENASMKRITFEYADEQSNWEWRQQTCTMPTVEDCIEWYGLGVDCDYRILNVEEV